MKGFDCNTKLSYETAKKFKEKGYDFVIRYVGRIKMDSFDLDEKEIENILNADLKLGIVQHCLNPDWTPSAELGKTYGINAGQFSKKLGVTENTCIYLDLEGIKKGTPKEVIVTYCNTWYDEVKKAGYTPGVYVGYNTFLNGEDLYYKLKYQHYWKSLSTVPVPFHRGYEMVQSAGGIVNGIEIDNNVVTSDNLGNSPIFMQKTKKIIKTIKFYDNGTYEEE